MDWLVALLIGSISLLLLPAALAPGRGGAAWEVLPAAFSIWLGNRAGEAAAAPWLLVLLLGVAGLAADRAFPVSAPPRRMPGVDAGIAGAAAGSLVGALLSGPWLWPISLPLGAGVGERLAGQTREAPDRLRAWVNYGISGLLMALAVAPWT